MSEHRSLKYRADIDGLRAIAIVAVLIFHFFPKALPGGFIGVDVFFVISGFLITEIISINIHGQTFSFRDFYERRIKRLFPALILVFSSVLLWGWFYLIDFEFAQLGKHLLGGIFFVYNFVAEKESGYFGGDAGFKLIHHIWSLAVEEQFYFVYPVYLIIAKRLNISFVKAIGFLIAVTFLLNVGQIAHVPNKVFYHPQYRMWELAFGGLVASLRYSLPSFTLSLASLAALIAGCFLMNEKTLFPGYWALVPVLSSCALVISARGTHFQKFLSLSWVTWIGKISYPLYLWHWPLFAATNFYGLSKDVPIQAAMFALSFILAGATYELIEKPIKRFNTTKVSQISLAAIGVIAVISLLIYRDRIRTLHSTETKLISDAYPQYNPPTANMSFNGYPVNFIDGKGALRKQKVLLLGDSLAYQYYPRFEKEIPLSSSSRSFYMLARGACPPIPGLHKVGFDYCNYIDSIMDFVNQQKFDIVVISARWDEYLGDKTEYRYEHSKNARESADLAARSLTQLIEKIKVTGSQVILFASTPSSPILDPRSMIRRSPTGLSISSQPLSLETLFTEQHVAREQLLKVAKETQTSCLNPLPIICPNGFCPTRAENGRPLYKDAVHFTAQTAADIDYIDFLVFDTKPEIKAQLRCVL